MIVYVLIVTCHAQPLRRKDGGGGGRLLLAQCLSDGAGERKGASGARDGESNADRNVGREMERERGGGGKEVERHAGHSGRIGEKVQQSERETNSETRDKMAERYSTKDASRRKGEECRQGDASPPPLPRSPSPSSQRRQTHRRQALR